MHRFVRILTLALLLPSMLVAQQSAEPTSVTLFNSGRVLVRRSLPVTVAAGTSTLTLPLGLFDAASLMILEPGVQLQHVMFDGAATEEAMLRRNVGQEFTLLVAGPTPSTIRATLLALQPERWLVNGAVVYARPGQIRWEPTKIPTSALSDVTVRSDRARSGLRLLYGMSGASWQANYALIVGTGGRIAGNASILNETLDIANTEVQLLAGDIGSPKSGVAYGARDQVAMSVMREAPQEEAVGEARLYTLPGRVAFVPGTQMVLPLFDPIAARAERRYSVSGAIPYYGGFGQQEDEQEVPVAVSYRLDRKLGTAFGDLPLPAGGIQVFEADKAGRLQLIGMGGIGHTAPGEELDVSTGSAFDVTARRTQTAYSTQRPAPNTNRTIGYATYKVDLQNAKDSAVVVEVREDRRGEWSIVESSLPVQRRSATRSVFLVTVPPKGKASVTYRIRVVW